MYLFELEFFSFPDICPGMAGWEGRGVQVRIQPMPGAGGWGYRIGGGNREECDEFSVQKGRGKTRGLRKLGQVRRTLNVVPHCWNVPWRQLGA